MGNHFTNLSGYSFNKKQVIRIPLKPLKTSFSKEDLQQLFAQKEVQEALFLASPDLLSECKNGSTKKLQINRKKKN